MPEGFAITETSSFFAAAISILFGVWHESIAAALSAKMPKQYLDRKPYIDSLLRIGLTKVVPLAAFLVGYIFIFGGAFIDLLRNRHLADNYFGERSVDAGASVFCLIFLVIAYLGCITVIQGIAVVVRVASARKQKPASEPRLRVII
jgi:hypothetical protein